MFPSTTSDPHIPFCVNCLRHRDDRVLAFRDINPQAPTHILVIPKRRQGLTQLNKASQRRRSSEQRPTALITISHPLSNTTSPHQPIQTTIQATDEQKGVLGSLLVAAAKVAAQEKLDKGYRVVINTGEDGGNTVKHLHLHILGGRPLAWCVQCCFWGFGLRFFGGGGG